MSITSIQRDTNNNVCFVRMISTDALATVGSTNYILNNQDSINALNGGVWGWFITDMILCAASDGNALLFFSNSTFSSLKFYGEQGSGTVNPGLANQVAYYNANGSTISGLATANNGVLATNGVGVPSITSILPSAVQLNITSLGTILAGTWQANPVGVPYGGTGDSSFTAYSVICAGTTAGGAFQNVSGLGTSGYILTSNGAAMLPTWQAAPGSGTVNPGTINDLAFYQTTGSAVSPLATANNSILITSGFGVPSWLANGTTGQVLTATTGSPASWAALPSSAVNFTGDSGTPFSTSSVTIYANNASNNCGTTVLFNASTPNITLQVTDTVNSNTIMGNGSGNSSLGARNTGFGQGVLATSLASGTADCTAFGYNCLPVVTEFGNTGYGSGCMLVLSAGVYNTCFGLGSGDQIVAGAYNIGFGYQAGHNWISGNSSNICIGHLGANEGNTIRIGTQGSGSGQQNACYVAGINNVNSSGFTTPQAVYVDSSNGQLGYVSDGQVPGTTTNDNASSGNVGEFVSSVIASGSAVSLNPGGTAADVTSISLTAGDWDVWGNVFISSSIDLAQGAIGWSSNTSATLPDSSVRSQLSSINSVSIGCAIPQLRYSLSTTTTIYLSAYGQTSTNMGTVTACGGIYARRVR